LPGQNALVTSAGAALPSGEVTFLFTDMAGSTRLFHDLGDRYAGVLRRHCELLRNAVANHHGVEIKTEGDSLFCAFSDADAAIAACVDAQRALQVEDWGGPSVRVRMGVHTGAAEPVGGDYIALAVHQAARISAAAHGGQILVSDATLRATETDTTRTAVDLGMHLLKDFDDPVRLWQVTAKGLPGDFPPLRTRSVRLPTTRTTFIGRQREVGELTARLRSPGLVTVIGPGGVGKTRLSVEAATALAAKDPTGVHFAELTSEVDEPGVAATLARQLGITGRRGQTLTATLADEIGDRRVLIVLDNCEQSVDAAAQVCAALLADCPALTVLATSRVPLEVDGEHRMTLAPLPLGAGEERTGDATRLFLDRVARTVERDAFDARELTAAAEICRRLDGLPLALELAAATAATMPLEVLLAELDNRLDLLRARGRTPRQRTLRALLDWSHELLSDEATRGLRRLAFFRGPFSLVAAGGVIAGPGDVPARAVPRVLAELTAHSFLSIESTTGRYEMLETVRVYAEDRLAAAGESDAAAAALVDWAGRWLAAYDFRQGFDMTRASRAITADYAAIAAALELADRRQDGAALTTMCAELGYYWFRRGWYDEGLRWCRRAIAAEVAPTRARCGSLTMAAGLLSWGGDPAEALRLLEHAKQIARELGDDVAFHNALIEEATAHTVLGDYDESIDLLRQVAAYAEENEHPQLLASAHNNTGVVRYWLGDFRGARAAYETARDVAVSSGRTRDLVGTLFNLGEVSIRLGEEEAARDRLREAVDRAAASDDTFRHLICLHLLLTVEDDPVRVAAYEQEVRRLRSHVGPDAVEAAARIGGYADAVLGGTDPAATPGPPPAGVTKG
jgi:predicted ATPase/class 3 adenylate cyclase